MQKQNYLAYITDIHGNLEALKRYVTLCENHNPPPDYAVLGGDISGKYADYLKLKGRQNKSFEKWKENSLKKALAILGEYQKRTFAILGNDDFESYDEILDQNGKVENLNCKIRYLEDEDIYFVGVHYVPPTPFHTRFELEEKELEKKLKELLEKVTSHSNAIWLFHSPPYSSGLDNTTDLLDRKIITVKVGSKAVRRAIERYQPKLFLCGHIHESSGVTWIGNSLCINPGAATSRDAKAVFIDLNDIEEFELISLN